METGEKWAANSKGMDDTITPQRLPKTVILSIFEREMSGWYIYLVERMRDRRLENHTSTTKSL